MHYFRTIPFASHFEDKRNVTRMHHISLLTCETFRKIVWISYPVTAAADLYKNTYAFTPLMGTEMDLIYMLILDLDKRPKVLPILSKSNVDSRFNGWFGLLQTVSEMRGGALFVCKIQFSLFDFLNPKINFMLRIEYLCQLQTHYLALTSTVPRPESLSQYITLSCSHSL